MSMSEVGKRLSQAAANVSRLEKDSHAPDFTIAYNDCQIEIDMIRVDIADLPPAQRREHRQVVKELLNKLKVIRNERDWTTRAEFGSPNLPVLDTPQGLIDHGRNLQSASIHSLQQQVGVVQDTLAVAKATATKVAQQRDQLVRLKTQMAEFDEPLQRVREILRRMMKRAISSKILWVLLTCIIAGVVLIIVLKTK
jgi:hypothetical protein